MIVRIGALIPFCFLFCEENYVYLFWQNSHAIKGQTVGHFINNKLLQIMRNIRICESFDTHSQLTVCIHLCIYK